MKELKNSTKLKQFKDIYNYYKIDSVVLKKLKLSLTNISFKLAYGEWCYDSKILVPKIIKVLDCLKVPEKNLKIIGVNKTKSKPKKFIKKNTIKYVPTLIVQRNKIEIGRVVEIVNENAETDILNIVLQKK